MNPLVSFGLEVDNHFLDLDAEGGLHGDKDSKSCRYNQVNNNTDEVEPEPHIHLNYQPMETKEISARLGIPISSETLLKSTLEINPQLKLLIPRKYLIGVFGTKSTKYLIGVFGTKVYVFFSSAVIFLGEERSRAEY